jgi:hypothetical protein
MHYKQNFIHSKTLLDLKKEPPLYETAHEAANILKAARHN